MIVLTRVSAAVIALLALGACGQASDGGTVTAAPAAAPAAQQTKVAKEDCPEQTLLGGELLWGAEDKGHASPEEAANVAVDGHINTHIRKTKKLKKEKVSKWVDPDNAKKERLFFADTDGKVVMAIDVIQNKNGEWFAEGFEGCGKES